MQKLLFFLGLLALSFNFNSQMWGPATPFASPAGQYQTGIQGGVTKLIEYNNELYASGNFIEAGGLIANCIARWNGSNWNTVYQGDFIQNSVVHDMIVFNNKLYFIANNLFVWDGTTIDTLSYLDQSSGNLNSIPGASSNFCIYNGDLYLGTGLSLYKITTNNVVSYEVINDFNGITALEVFNGDFYVGGLGGLLKNVNGAWISVTGNTYPWIKDLVSFENHLYAHGEFYSIGLVTVNKFAKFDGQNWSNEVLFPNITFVSNTASSILIPNSMNVINNALILTYPTNLNSGNQPHVFAKQNGNWNVLGSFDPINILLGQCFTSCLFQNQIYVGGNFGNGLSGNQTIRNLMKIGSSVLNISNISEINLNLFPNPTSHSITIKGETNMNQSFQLFDQMGREVFKGKLTGTETEVNLSSLSKGMYSLKIEGNYQPAQIVKE
jgi:trimeric autotransporter adhesin